MAYRYGALALATPAALQAETLWIAGGLYGNAQALASLESLVAEDHAGAMLVFNGDFHWFDVASDAFARIEAGVLRHVATRGNVETEIAAPHPGAGCGCAYPEWVDDRDVARSNRILERLRETASRAPGTARRLAALPMHLVAEIGGARVGIVHGDGESLAGWGFSQEALATPGGSAAAARWFGLAGVGVFASSHTCLPVLRSLGGGIVINNGAAGMPNFQGTGYGLATRISVVPYANALYGARARGLYVDAVAIPFDAQAWQAVFLAQWPEGSDAHASYWGRITAGPNYGIERALAAGA
ncbi:MAG: metallophosphoesterase family protein [Betaproteobacteria bacterium]